jgi:hypothetical protein
MAARCCLTDGFSNFSPKVSHKRRHGSARYPPAPGRGYRTKQRRANTRADTRRECCRSRLSRKNWRTRRAARSPASLTTFGATIARPNGFVDPAARSRVAAFSRMRAFVINCADRLPDLITASSRSRKYVVKLCAEDGRDGYRGKEASRQSRSAIHNRRRPRQTQEALPPIWSDSGD